MAKQINYNVTGERRKALVRAIGEILGEDAVYQGAPTFAFAVDGYIISRSGIVTCPESAAPNEIAQLTAALLEQGYAPETPEDRFTVAIPRDDISEEACANLKKIIASKASVLKKAIGTDSLEFELTEDKILFPWFILRGLDGEADAYMRLTAAMCEMAKKQKRVIAKDRDLDNDKLTMRLFLIRLGFIGDEYKSARKILLRNLTGNSSWRSGHPPERCERTQADAPYEKQRLS